MEWRFTTMNLHELVRRFQAGETRNAISRAMDLSVNTVTAYRRWAEAQNLLAGPLPDLATLERLRQATRNAQPGRAPNESSLEAYRTEVTVLLESGRKPRAIWTLLQRRHPGLVTSEAAVWRLVQSIGAGQPPEVVGRIETAPGEVAQVDFGYVGYLRDPQTGQKRKAWAFVLVLAWSRHMFAEFVFDQKIATWLICHQHAFAFFHAVPRRIVLDNLKAAIIRAYSQDEDPAVQQSYRECAEHYGFLIDPCLPRRPEHKGKVERGGVGYLKQSFLPVLEGEPTLPEANRQLRQWLLETAAQRVHGTTRAVPWERFTQTEWLAMLPEPVADYDPAVWKQAQLHRDGHVTFEKAYYSAPHRLVGQTLWLRAGLRDVRLFTERFELIASHPRAQAPGERFTQPDHLPAHLAAALATTRETTQAQADGIGPATAQVVSELLASRPVDRLRTALRVLRLAEQFTPARLETACRRGLAFGDTQFITLKRVLEAGGEAESQPAPSPIPGDSDELIFARSPEELARAILGGATWN